MHVWCVTILLMKYIYICIFILIILNFNNISSLHAAGEIRKLKGLADSMDSMEAQGKKDGINYQKADAFLSGSDISNGLTGSDLVKICGEPVAKADNGSRWVYKPPTSTFFKGEKIYFYFDKDQKLIAWDKVYQE